MTLVTTSEEVFACYRRSCAPPPVGRGGSNKGGRRGGDAARRAGIAKAKEAGVYSNKKKLFNRPEAEQDEMIHAAVQRAGRKAAFKHRGGKKKKEANEFIDAETAYDKYRALQKANRAKKGDSRLSSDDKRGLAKWEADAQKAESLGNKKLAGEIRDNIKRRRRELGVGGLT